ncbi:hypothetical protein COCC4DRAFT_42094 [Bipolaris maydis ATCC 48331]|uniref:Uncharacterized protein n=2 Tax=Cochliobolus heterostrophus TaxID=5016 RepID=M2UEZ0_COCH5|nr:uncharacterized protein COCC4DRAFT_42094 [Bipolaris maydis ATCC 48331]EMD86573.1 hypothetical protein COCHEDRAFT_1218160 [Bipolaris maydis C5]ENI02987.1 hypothetical protein COCC4DRAFT_42094 [Bipolaris maydis ATCC 48331]KAJ6192340.1 hypothetical protein J3E72DRAFT_380110 [Bipolaris maydis]KAJ6267501.1 hypothetical protein PSV08DRAFT_355065 [Bipolaris maydis]
MTTAASYKELTKLESARLPLCMLACKGVPDVDYEKLAVLRNTDPFQLFKEMAQIWYKKGLLDGHATTLTTSEKADRGASALFHATSNKHGADSQDINSELPLKGKGDPAKTSGGNDGQIILDQSDDLSDTSNVCAGDVQEAVEGLA